MQYNLPTSSVSEHFKRQALALTDAIAHKDLGTAGHGQRTADYAVKLARELPGMSQETIELVRWAAILHDIGKIEVDKSILNKAAALEPEERTSMREHPWLGFKLLSRFVTAEDISDGTLYHHERWDGLGYPFGLSGRAIPWVARLIAVADSYDAMVSHRPYRRGRSPNWAYAEILSQSGRQFDPAMVQAFARAFRELACEASCG